MKPTHEFRCITCDHLPHMRLVYDKEAGRNVEERIPDQLTLEEVLNAIAAEGWNIHVILPTAQEGFAEGVAIRARSTVVASRRLPLEEGEEPYRV